MDFQLYKLFNFSIILRFWNFGKTRDKLLYCDIDILLKISRSLTLGEYSTFYFRHRENFCTRKFVAIQNIARPWIASPPRADCKDKALILFLAYFSLFIAK